MLTTRFVLTSRCALLGFLLMVTSALFAAVPVEQVIYNFNLNNDGRQTSNGLVADSAGNLYGVTARGGMGANNNGAVFELSPPATASGAWTESILYSFGQALGDGAVPDGTLIFDQSGNLYGTTTIGGIWRRWNHLRAKPTGHHWRRLDRNRHLLISLERQSREPAQR